MNDQELITVLKESVTGTHMAVPVERIVSRSRVIRARRRITGAAGAVAVTAGAALAVAALLPSGHQPGQPSRAQLAAFSVVTGPDGATTLTLYSGQVINPGAVRRALAEHGIPALVTAGKFCYGDPHVAAGARQVVVVPTGTSWPAGTIVIHGAAIPSGEELSIGYRQDTQNRMQHREISFTLIRASAPLTCTSIPDD
jgi:hypothetical protein